ncbi:MAG: UDP-3-O-acyl-N-acetylglucosamine deacetylase, partial [Candidatus Babeliales bacterium]
MLRQQTLKQRVKFSGLGVHSGLSSVLTLIPAPENTGILFCNASNPEQRFRVGTVIPEVAPHATVIKINGWYVTTIEHLMATLRMLDVDNVVVEMRGNEVPILDGSALPFVQGILDAGLQEQGTPRKYLTPKEKLRFADEKGRVIEIEPFAPFDTNSLCEFTQGKRDFSPVDSAKSVRPECFAQQNVSKDEQPMNSFSISYTADFTHPLAGGTTFSAEVLPEFFIDKIAPARTFGYLEQLPLLRQHKLAQGSSLSNTIVIGQELLNDTRFPDECVRHKVLDLIGDLGLLPYRLLGAVSASKTSHNFNRLVAEHCLQHPELWQEI